MRMNPLPARIAGAVFGLGAVAALAGASVAAVGNDMSLGADYSLSIAGLPFAKGTLSMALKGDRYAARVKIRTWGIAKLIVESSSLAEASGRVGGKRIRPGKYSLDSRTKSLDTNVRMRLSGGAVRAVTASPPLRKLPDRVPVTSRHKANVLDPLSASILPYRLRNGQIGKDACRQTIPIFDGWTRFDVKLYFRRFAEVKTDAYTGKAAVCGARWVPVAGHRPNKKTVVYLRENKQLETWLVPIAESGILVPYRISIMTKAGELLIRNKRLVVTGKGRKHAAR